MVQQKTQLVAASAAALIGAAHADDCQLPASWNATVSQTYEHPNGWIGGCTNGQHCLYECKMGYERNAGIGYDSSKCPPNALTGCNDVWSAATGTNGPLCTNGVAQTNNQEPCRKVGEFVKVESFLGAGRGVTVSKITYPGDEGYGPSVTTEDGAAGGKYVSYYSAEYWGGQVSSSFYVNGPELPGYKAPADSGAYSNIYAAPYNFGGNIKQEGDHYRLSVNGETAKIEWWDATNSANANNGQANIYGAVNAAVGGFGMEVQTCANGDENACVTQCKMIQNGDNAKAWVNGKVTTGSGSSFGAQCYPSVQISKADYESNAQKPYIKFRFVKAEELQF